MELTSKHKTGYGFYGIPPNPDKCAFSLGGRQCFRRRGYGPEGAYCKQHDPDAKAAKRKAADEARAAMRQARDDAERARKLREEAALIRPYIDVLREIAKCHDNPVEAAQVAVVDFDAKYGEDSK